MIIDKIQIRPRYGEVDQMGYVYHANYISYCHQARTELLRTLGFEQDRLAEEDGIIFAVRRVEVEFHAPARFNDALQVHVRMQESKKVSMTFRQEIREVHSDRLLCSGVVQVACIDLEQFRPCAIPELLLQEIADAV